MHPAAQLPKRLLVDWPNCVSVVEFELCDHAYPAVDPFDVASNGPALAKTSRSPSEHAVAKRLRSGLNASPWAAPRYADVGRSEGQCRLPRAERIQSWLPVATIVPSGLKAMQSICPSCASGSPIGLPVSASHSRAVPSGHAVTTERPRGL